MRLFHFLILLIFAAGPLQSQSPGGLRTRLTEGRYSFQLAYQQGGVFDTNDFVAGKNATGLPIDRHQAVSVRLAMQTTGSREWEQLYAWPRYGIGLFMADFRSREVGRPISCFGFLTGPLFRTGPFSLNYDLAIGLAFHWNEYDPVTNPFNTAIGSVINSHIEAGIGAEFELSDRLTAATGLGVTHFSNGGITPPNRGINTSFWKFSMRYELYDREAIRVKHPIKPFKPVNEWTLAGYAGFKNMEVPVTVEPTRKAPTVPIYAGGIIGSYHRLVDRKSKFGAGLVVGYTGLINPRFDFTADTVYLNRKPDPRRIEISAFPSYELVFNKFSLLIQAGFYLYRHEYIRSSPIFYQRLGFRYDFSRHHFAALHLRARNFNTAELLEWTLGYRW
jgi:hypothetical protein